MTYCVALRVKAGLVMLADTRTNAGLDDISRFRKLFTYDVPGERVLGVMMSGNLSITQGVHSILSRAIRNSADDPGVETLLNCDSMFRARSEEHTSELQSLMRISYAVFCLKNKKNNNYIKNIYH